MDISDLVSTVAIILGRTNHSDASSAKLIQSSNGLSFKANGHVSGFQMTLQHNVNFSMELNESAWIADYKTNGKNGKRL